MVLDRSTEVVAPSCNFLEAGGGSIPGLHWDVDGAIAVSLTVI